MNKKSILLALAILVLSGCVKTREQLRADGEDDAPVLRKQTAQQQQPYKEKAPATGFRFEEVDEQLRALNGRVDSIENRVNQADAASAGEKQSVTTMATAIDAKFQAYEEELRKLRADLQAMKDEQAAARAKAAEVAAPAAKGKTAYDDGEELFNKKQWKEAIVSYQKYRDANPKGKLYGDATYKIGVCFQELKLKDEAKAFFEEVISKFPNSKEAKKAAFRMKSLK